MEGLIDNGEDWMAPLMEIRNFLVVTRDNPEKYRQKARRNKTISEHLWGPYTFETREKILRRILIAQKEIQSSEGIELITHQELVLIQYHWYRDCYFKTRVSDIYNSIYTNKIDMSKQQEKFKQESDLLKQSCNNDSKDVDLIQDLLALQKTKTLMIRKRGLQADIESRLDQFLEAEKRSL